MSVCKMKKYRAFATVQFELEARDEYDGYRIAEDIASGQFEIPSNSSWEILDISEIERSQK